jgi:hypothetical protein
LSGRGLCEELITRPEESYRLCCVAVCDLETSRIGAPYIYYISHLRVNILFFWLMAPCRLVVGYTPLQDRIWRQYKCPDGLITPYQTTRCYDTRQYGFSPTEELVPTATAWSLTNPLPALSNVPW